MSNNIENEFWGFFPFFFKWFLPIFYLTHITQLSEEKGKGCFLPFCTVMDVKNGETKQDRLEKFKKIIIMSHFRREVYWTDYYIKQRKYQAVSTVWKTKGSNRIAFTSLEHLYQNSKLIFLNHQVVFINNTEYPDLFLSYKSTRQSCQK